jgi:jumonji domain-containing protein 2
MDSPKENEPHPVQTASLMDTHQLLERALRPRRVSMSNHLPFSVMEYPDLPGPSKRRRTSEPDHLYSPKLNGPGLAYNLSLDDIKVHGSGDAHVQEPVHNELAPDPASDPEESALPQQDDLDSSELSALNDLDAQSPSRRSSIASILSSPPSSPIGLDPEYELEVSPIAFDHDAGSSGILRLRPTLEQWQDFSTILSAARELEAEKDGCFKVVIPEGAVGSLPERPARVAKSNAFKPQLIKKSRNFRVHTIPTEAVFPAAPLLDEDRDYEEPKVAAEKLRKIFMKNHNRQLRNVRYRVDIPAWTPEQRLAAGVPAESPIYPLKGDQLDYTKAVIPGIHTPYVYESGPAFGATFQIHAEDYRLLSLNHLYRGRKVWIIVPSADVDLAEEKLERKGKCSQFMRHRAEFLFPDKLNRLGVPYRTIDQRAGETIVIFQDAYHQGFSDGYTLAEAKNYADPSWNTSNYQPCDSSCKLDTAIPDEYMKRLAVGEKRIDLCSTFSEVGLSQKRPRDRVEAEDRDLDLLSKNGSTTTFSDRLPPATPLVSQ